MSQLLKENELEDKYGYFRVVLNLFNDGKYTLASAYFKEMKHESRKQMLTWLGDGPAYNYFQFSE